MKTTDPVTLAITEDILKNNQFLRDNVLNCPGTSLSETASRIIKICDINHYSDRKNQYQEWFQSGKKRIVAIGGPSAFDQTLISALIKDIRDTHDISFYCKNYI
jgi:hypothetical protein